MADDYSSGQTAVIEISESEATPAEEGVFKKSDLHLVPVTGQKPRMLSTKIRHAKKAVVDRRIAKLTDGEQEFQAVMVDLDFELFTRGEPTPAVIGKIVHRYWRVAWAAMEQQPGQHDLVIILRANPDTIAKVRTHSTQDLRKAICETFLRSKTEQISLRVELRAKTPVSSRSKKQTPPGPVHEDEIRQLLGNLHAPGVE